MSLTVPLALFSWPLVVVALFTLLQPRRAVVAAFLFAWLFLPMAGYRLYGLPNYTKMSATVIGVMLAIMIFDAGRVMKFRPSLLDLPMVAWCLAPMASSMTNGLGAYDGLSEVMGEIISWGLPYLIGRMYFSDLEGLRDLALGIFIGGLLYVPLCLFEMRMSPQLHNLVYGYHANSFAQTVRFGGWRPTVFMQHGLAVALWMAIASVLGVWLWRSRAIRFLWNVPFAYLVLPVLATTLLCRSVGALVLLVIGIGALFTTQLTRMRMCILAIALCPALYIGVRAVDAWDGAELVTAAATFAGEDRAGSLQYRLDAEDVLSAHARRQFAFGWGGWGRNRPAQMGFDEPDVPTDGLWIIAFGQRGVIGLVTLVAVILLPAIVFIHRVPASMWAHPAIAPAAALAVVLVLFMIDSLFNAMLNPLYLLAAGGLSGWCANLARHRRRLPRAAQLQVARRYGVLHP